MMHSIKFLMLRARTKTVAFFTRRSATDVALDHSVSRWREIVSAIRSRDALRFHEMLEPGAVACALCAVHFDTSTWSCAGCPIREKTGRDHCHGTPYHDVRLNAKRLVFDEAERHAGAMVGLLEDIKRERAR